jgi:hypothetical protein
MKNELGLHHEQTRLLGSRLPVDFTERHTSSGYCHFAKTQWMPLLDPAATCAG